MLVDVRNWVKVSALGLALFGACSGAALADSVPYDQSGAQSSQYNMTTRNTTNADVAYTHAPYYQALRGRTLSVGITLTPPFAFVTDSLSVFQGIDVDLINELQKRTGFSIEGGRPFVINFNELMESAYEGKMDIMGGGITFTPSRAKVFDFSAPFMQTALVLLAKDGSPISDVKDLDGRSLAAESGSTAVDFFPEAKNMHIELKENSSVFMAMYSVHTQTADAVVVDRPMAEFYIQNWPDAGFHVVEQVSGEDPLCLMFKKNPQVSHILQAAYEDMVKDGTVQRIVDSYVHNDANTQTKSLARAQ